MGEYDLPSDKEDKEFVPEFGWNGAVLNAPHVTDEVREQLQKPINYSVAKDPNYQAYFNSHEIWPLTGRAILAVSFCSWATYLVGHYFLSENENALFFGYAWSDWEVVLWWTIGIALLFSLLIQNLWIRSYKKRANQN